MKIYKKQSGFSGLELVLAVALTALLVGGGVYIYTTKSPSSNQMSSNQVKKTSGNQKSDSQYLKVPELGVEIPLSNDIKDLQYSKSSYGGIVFSTKKLSESSKGFCSEVGESYPLGITYKKLKTSLSTDPESRWTDRLDGLKDSVQKGHAKEFEDFFVYNDGPQAPCSDEESVNEMQSVQSEALDKAISQSREIK